MTLTEFLLARIAEDEYTASAPVATPSEYGYSAETIKANGVNGLWWSHDESLLGIGPRLLAECAAKRRILDIHSGPQYGWPDKHLCHDSMETTDQCDTARALATVYADHPDYQPEWGDPA